MSHRTVLNAALAATRESPSRAVLAIVVDTEGSTYAHAGALAVFGALAGQSGWLSGGCLEPEIEARAAEASRAGALDWMDIDTRDDDALFSGSAVGCRGRLHVALLPLAAVPGIDGVIDAWELGDQPLAIALSRDGDIAFACGGASIAHRIAVQPRSDLPVHDAYTLSIPPAPRVALFGGGPESASLLAWLRTLGWRTALAECRPRWRSLASHADIDWDLTPTEAATRVETFDAALVMHHNFELDREALDALAQASVPFIGLLGPRRRRDDLFKVLPMHVREGLRTRVRSPVGMALGGHGPEAIALSIVAQLQAHHHGVSA